MTLKDKVAAVALAETGCQRARDDAEASLARLKSEFRRGATPVRIVVSGLALGFASGIATPGGAASAGGKFVSGPLFSLILDSVLPGVLAGITAASSASSEIEQAADTAVEEAVEEAGQPPREPIAEPAAQAVPAKPKRKRTPKGPRRDRADA